MLAVDLNLLNLIQVDWGYDQNNDPYDWGNYCTFKIRKIQ